MYSRWWRFKFVDMIIKLSVLLAKLAISTQCACFDLPTSADIRILRNISERHIGSQKPKARP